MSELIFKPLVNLIQGLGGRIQGGRLASDLDVNPETGRVQGVIARSRDGSETTYPADAVIFAVGITGGGHHVAATPSSPLLMPEKLKSAKQEATERSNNAARLLKSTRCHDSIGFLMLQCEAGVCVHRSSLFSHSEIMQRNFHIHAIEPLLLYSFSSAGAVWHMLC